jgi:hypothetical protein
MNQPDGQKRVVLGFKARAYNIPKGSIGAYYRNEYLAFFGAPRPQEQNPGGKIDSGFGQTAMRSRVMSVMRNVRHELRPSLQRSNEQ